MTEDLEEFDKNKTKVLKYILYKKRTENEIRTKFKSDIEENMLEDVIQYLKDAGYINDIDYIEKTINNFKNLKNLSIKELKYKLQAKGIKSYDLEDYFCNNDEDLKEYEINSAKNIIIKKQKDLDEQDIRTYLMKKGYQKDSIDEAFEIVK